MEQQFNHKQDHTIDLKNNIDNENYVQKEQKGAKKGKRIARWIVAVIALLLVGFGAFLGGQMLLQHNNTSQERSGFFQKDKLSKKEKEEQEKQEKEKQRLREWTKRKDEAARLSAGYDYDAAIKVYQQAQQDGLIGEEAVSEQIAQWEAAKQTLVEYPIDQVTHIFFHTLINDCEKVFDGDYKEQDYNQVMTTTEEFRAILESMYAKGYVLVSLHDMAGYVPGEDQTTTWETGKIMLPEGKKAFVISQDDVSYYEYMEGDGYPSRLLIGEDGNITNEVIKDDGTREYGSFDMVPMLEDFIREHPDFSYRGARGYLALTGYDGVLGYRTADKYKESLGEDEWARQVEEAKKVANRLIEQGWEFASHSWGHRYYGQISLNQLMTDAEKWEKQVRPILENNGTYKVDTIIFAFGDDIGSWKPYNADNEKFQYLKGLGFDYFCNVDSNRVWVQNEPSLGYLRQGRRNLDGQRMYYDMIDDSVDYLSDLFDVTQVFDKRRPVPVVK